MKPIYCPKCKRLLFKAEFANVEIKCGSCKRLVKINMYSQKSLLFNAESKKNEIEAIEDKEKKKKED